MKRSVTICAFIATVLSLTSLTANGVSAFYTGSISPSTVGSSVTTTLPMFNSALGTLTGVQLQLDLTVTPYAEIYNNSGGPRTFTSADWASFSYAPANIWTVSHNADSWTLAAPTVATGTIYGSGQVLPNATDLKFVGGTSVTKNLTASGQDLAAYIGTGSLVFGTTGSGQTYGGGPFASGGGFVGGGGDLTGTASVTYNYTPVPEPTALAILCLGGLAVMLRKRQ